MNAPAAAAGHAAAPGLPPADAWRAAAVAHEELFAPLDRGARVGLIARQAPVRMLVWQAGADGVAVAAEPFAGYAAAAVDILLAADGEALAEIVSTGAPDLIGVLRAGIRRGSVVCYMLQRRCVLEERGYDELLDALGFAFMGACR